MDFSENIAQKQFELHLGDAVAFVEYAREGDKIYLTHTEVPKSHQGKGIGSELIHKTLTQIKNEGEIVVPLCSFVAWYVNENEQWHSILAEGYQL